jgi:hypothetical protein
MGCVGKSGVGVGFGQDAFLQIRGELFSAFGCSKALFVGWITDRVSHAYR